MPEHGFERAYPMARRAAQVRGASLAIHLADRKDFEQEIVIRVWLALPKFDAKRAALPTFVERVASTTAASLARRASAKRRTPEPLPPPADSLQLLAKLELRVDLERAFSNLNQEDRRLAGELAGRPYTAESRQFARLWSERELQNICDHPDSFLENGVYSNRTVGPSNQPPRGTPRTAFACRKAGRISRSSASLGGRNAIQRDARGWRCWKRRSAEGHTWKLRALGIVSVR